MIPDTTAMSKGKDNVPDVPPDTGKAMAFPQFRQTMMAPYRTGDITHSRVAVLRDLGYAVQVPLDYFKTAAVDIKNIGKSLEIPLYRLSMKFQSKRIEPEDELFKPLSTLFSKVVKEVGKKLGTQSDVASWDDHIAVAFEFKRGSTDALRKDVSDIHRDERQILWSLHRIMRGDPGRRATFGITIENGQTRFSYTCKAIALVSQEFNIYEGREHLAYFLRSLAFASDHELRWDRTVQRMHAEGEIRYKLTANWTTRDISDFNADASRGRRARIFEACHKSQNGKPVKAAEPVVLKDSWRDRETEECILEQIFADLADHKGVEQVDEARKYFLTVLAAGDVKVDGEIGGYPWPFPHGRSTTCCTSYPIPVDELPKSKPTRLDEGLPPIFPYIPSPTVRPTIHHRIHTHLEVGQPIYELRNVDAVFKTLQDAHKALDSVSTGNVLRVGYMGKLADLEYAKHVESETIHDGRTYHVDQDGSQPSMAHEVEDVHQVMTTYFNSEKEMPPVEALAHTEPLKTSTPSLPNT
ncbi:hypothetical protein EDC04DRAFT_2610087 [Pisolithus marmoratus]|nr:hypothetical protein EDC04DRAFT_2610087 [Pisolithus marmoratus]